MEFSCNHVEQFIQKALGYACQNFDHVFYFTPNDYLNDYHKFPKVLVFGAAKIFSKSSTFDFEEFKNFHAQSNRTIFGILNYDLKNIFYDLQSNHPDLVHFDLITFIEPEILIKFGNDNVEVTSINGNENEIYSVIMAHENGISPKYNFSFTSRYTKAEYIENVLKIKQHIQRGDIYELNFCQEFFAKNAQIEPVSTFLKLNEISPMPYASLVKCGNSYAICASPERFLLKKDDLIISQPIKGTIKRGATTQEDEQLKLSLQNSEKECAENVMIVDLVRNDLSHTAKDGSVKVEELFGIKTFPQVHQMVSTISAIQSKTFHFIDTIQNCFPMGSMTGAPKINAMKLIERYENVNRGLFSGSIGYITPQGDFDFNVVIRSILYNSQSGYLSFQAGSAITSDADPEKEWEECEIKTKGIKEVLCEGD